MGSGVLRILSYFRVGELQVFPLAGASVMIFYFIFFVYGSLQSEDTQMPRSIAVDNVSRKESSVPVFTAIF